MASLRKSRKRSSKRSRKRSSKRISKRSRKRSSKRSSKRSHKSSSKSSRKLKGVLDYKKLLSELTTAEKNKLPVTLKKHKYAGTGLFATKPIKSGKIIAYYRMKVHTDTTAKPYNSPTDAVYCFTVYTKGGNMSQTLMGDLDEKSAPPPRNNIPYWAYFSNEPSGKLTENAYIDINLKENYKNRNKLKDGDFITYKLKASRNIKAGEEIVWCYGEAYERDYKTTCE